MPDVPTSDVRELAIEQLQQEGVTDPTEAAIEARVALIESEA